MYSVCVYNSERVQPSASIFQFLHLQPWREVVQLCCLLLGQSLFFLGGGWWSKDHHSRPRAGWREWILKVGPLAVWRRKGFGGQGDSGLLPGVGIAFLLPSCCHRGEKPVPFLTSDN